MNRKSIIFFLFAILNFVAPLLVKATIGDIFINENYQFTVENEIEKTVSLTALSVNPSQIQGVLILPETAYNKGVEYKVVSVGKDAMQNCERLTDLTIPNSYTNIEDGAFWGCNSLASLTLSSSVEKLGSKPIIVTGESQGSRAYNEDLFPFKNCPIETLYIDSNTIGEWFVDCVTLSDLQMGPNVKYIGQNAFMGCTGLTSLNIPQGVEAISRGSFSYCDNLTEMHIPASVNSITKKWHDVELHSYVGNDDGYTIGAFAFTPIKTLYIDSKNIGSWFKDYTSIQNLYLGESVETIGQEAFNGCSGITSVKFPKSLKKISSMAFANTSLSSFICPESLVEIESAAFLNCKMSSIIIPENLKNIGFNAFSGCPVKYLEINNDVVNVYERFDKRYLEEVFFKPSLTSIPSLSGYSSLTKVTLPLSLQYLPQKAFADCSALRFLTLPETLSEIGYEAFLNCESLQSITFPETLISIQSEAFMNCISLQNIELPPSLNYLGENVFKNCKTLNTIKISNSVSQLPFGMAEGALSLTDITIPSGVIKINENAFKDCSSLTQVTLGKDLLEIQDYAFENCNNISLILSYSYYPPVAGNYSFPFSIYPVAVIKVMSESLGFYKTTNPWNRFQNYQTYNKDDSDDIKEILNDKEALFNIYDYSGKLIYYNFNLQNFNTLPKGQYLLKSKSKSIKVQK